MEQLIKDRGTVSVSGVLLFLQSDRTLQNTHTQKQTRPNETVSDLFAASNFPDFCK